MPFMYNNPLFAISLPNSSITQYSTLDSSDVEESIEEEITTFDNFNAPFAFSASISPIISINRSVYYKDKIKKFNYLCKGRKVKNLKI
jgi:hypothetical protein